jgi:pimeloyl-ACP methyl ester carboxylesterase
VWFIHSQDKRLAENWRRGSSCFQKAAALFDPPIARIEVPFKPSPLHGYFIPAVSRAAKAPTLIFTTGGEGWAESGYFWVGAAGRCRGYNRYARVPDFLPKDITMDFENAERQRLDFDPRTSWEKIRIPVLAVWGALDRSVPVKESAARLAEALKQAGNRDYTLVTFPKGNHEGFEAETGFEDYARLRRYVPEYHETILCGELHHSTVR